MSSTVWKHYTWLIAPERLSLFWRDSGQPESEDELFFFMEVPEDEENLDQINQAHGSFATSMPLLYEWFDEINAVRFFINKDASFSNIKISKTGAPLNTYVEFQRQSEEILNTEKIYDLTLEIFNESVSDSTLYNIKLMDGNEALVNGFTEGSGYFVPGDDGSSTIPLTLVPDDDEITDTLTFEVTEVIGGNLASAGTVNRFNLIIKAATSYAGGIFNILHIYPNPTSDVIHFNGIEEQLIMDIYDAAGRLFLTKKIQHDCSVEVSNLKPGIYMLKLHNEKFIKTIKIKKY